MIVLGIETSCDETAAAVVDGERRICANIVLSQLAEHTPYGGVVPEIAARAHLDHVERVTGEALSAAGLRLADLDGVAATTGPGLIGGVIVGATFAKSLAMAVGKRFVAVNHLEGHALTCRLTDGIGFPYLLLLVSGGHCQLLGVSGVGRYRRFGTTIDDAAGEAFDKVAKLLGLGFPGGPAVERAARDGDPRRFALPRPMLGRPDADFSFSGLKTAVRHVARDLPPGDFAPRDLADLAASFQAAVGDVLVDRSRNAMHRFAALHPGTRRFVVAGGVAANLTLRARLAELCAAEGFELAVPPVALCTDNAAMIAWAGLERLDLGLSDGLDAPARPRWPLDTPDDSRRDSGRVA
jgi:N6-L-threonylcarbamoyladenine synthase